VLGSFVVSSAGELAGRDLPAVFDDALLADVGPRVRRLEEALGGDAKADAVVMRFSEHKLQLRFIKGGTLAVMSGAGVNAATLRMAVTLTARRVENELEALPPLALTVRKAPSLPAPGEPPSAGRAAMTYRGRRIQ
jgi:hypothetical protein